MKKIIIVSHYAANRKSVASNRINDTFKYITGVEKILIIPRIYPREQKDEFDNNCFSKIIYTFNLEPNLLENWIKYSLKRIKYIKDRLIRRKKESLKKEKDKKLYLKTKNVSYKHKSVLKSVLRNLINFIDPFKFNIPFIFFKLYKHARSNNSIIFISGKPFSYLIPCVFAKKIYKSKIVFDLRDNWKVGEFINSPPLSKIEKKLKVKLLNQVDKVITVSEPIKLELSNWTNSSINVIPNGFDGNIESLKNFCPGKFLCRNKIKIGYFGNIYRERGENLILKALEDSEKKDKIQFDFYGQVSSSSNFYRSKYVNIHSMVSRNEMFSIMRNYDYLLLLLVYNLDLIGVSSGKIFEYIRSGIPILALVSEKGNEPAVNLIKETKTGIVVDPADKENLKKLFNNLDNPNCIKKYFNPNYDIITMYSRKNLAKRFEKVLGLLYES